ncbi:MAG: PIN domain-containing protein [Mesorhizobium sp.]
MVSPFVSRVRSLLRFQRERGSTTGVRVPRNLRYLERIVVEFDARILAFTTAEALKFGEVVSRRAAVGRPILPFDAMIAAICLVHGATLATRNVRDFEQLDLALVNPFEAGA